MDTSRWLILLVSLVGFVAAIYFIAAVLVRTSCGDPDLSPFCRTWTVDRVTIPNPHEHIDKDHQFHIEDGGLNLVVRPQGELTELWGFRNSLRKKIDEGGEVCLWTTIDPLHTDPSGGPKTEQHHLVLFLLKEADTRDEDTLVVCMLPDYPALDKCTCRTPSSHGGAAHVHP